MQKVKAFVVPTTTCFSVIGSERYADPMLGLFYFNLVIQMIVVLTLLLVLSKADTAQQIFGKLKGSGNWGEGTSSQVCYNMDYLMRLQHTIDLPGVRQIVEIGFGDWSITGLMHLQGKNYTGYEVLRDLYSEVVPSNVRMKYVDSVREVKDGGDLLIVKDVLMYLPNSDIEYVIDQLLPKFKYALLEFAASGQPHLDQPMGVYRPLKLSLKGRRVISKVYRSTLKETWLISGHNSLLPDILCKNYFIGMGVKQNKNEKRGRGARRGQEEQEEEESNETMPIFALGNLSLDERAISNATVAPEDERMMPACPTEGTRFKPIRKRGQKSQTETKDRLKQKISVLTRRVQQLQEELALAHRQEDSCPHCHFYLSRPTTQRESHTPGQELIDCFKRSTSRDSIEFEKIDFTAPLMYSPEMEEKSWIFLGTVLIAMGSKVLDIDGTVNVFRILKESVDKIRRQVDKSQGKLSLDFFLGKEQLQGERGMDQLCFDPFYSKEEYRGGLQLQGVRVQAVEQYELCFDQKLTFNVKYDALITIMEYMKENSNISIN